MPALEGLRIVVTRAAHQAEELARPLRESGAEVILLPAIGIAPPSNPEPLRQAAAGCDEYAWIIFTSANTVAPFIRELRQPAGTCKSRIATVGAATREIAERAGFRVRMTPQEYVAESLVDAFGNEDLNGCRILIPGAAVTRSVVANELRKRGARVDIVEAYRNVLPPETAERAANVLRELHPDWITFASSSAVDNVVGLSGPELLRNMKIASIGPITSESVRKHGLTVTAEARVHSVAGLVEAICRCHELQ